MNPFRSKRGLPADPGKNNWHLSGGEIPWASQEQEEGAMGPCALRTWEMSQGFSGVKMRGIKDVISLKDQFG